MMAEDSSLSAGENSRHPTPVPARSAVSCRVDATVEAVQTPEPYATRGRALVDPHCVDLLHGHDSVLPSCDLCQARVGRVAFLSHSESKSTGASNSPPCLLLFVATSGY